MTDAEKEYGGALYGLAAEEHLEDAVLQGLETALAVFVQNPGYAKLLENPAVKRDERLALLDKAFRGGVPDYVLNFLKILCEKNALGLLKGCEKDYRARLYEARGILPVTAESAVPLTQAQAAALQAKLQAATGKTILLTNKVEPGVLGGVKLSYAGKELDGSVAGRLSAIRTALAAQ